MDETEKYIRSLLEQQKIETPEKFHVAFAEFTSSEENINNVKSIRLLQQQMTKNWQIIARREEIKTFQLALPNGFAGRPYKAELNFLAHGLTDITSYSLTGFESTGLDYDPETKMITGTPAANGDIALQLAYNFEGEPEDAEPNQKKITIIINPDPKSLWKSLPSDAGDRFAKVDDIAEEGTLMGKTLVAASKRGRAHANKGTFRDDDYAYAEFDNGWGIVAISDGAGSAQYARKGSAVACQSVINYFTNADLSLLDEALSKYIEDKTIQPKLRDIANSHLLASAKKAHADIEFLAKAVDAPIADFHCTLAFALIKELSSGCAFFGFGVGDCPVALVARNFEWVMPLNVLDVGEFGGGTRFITMPEIFRDEVVDERCTFHFVKEFPYLVLMSDGIYDPKFEVEANLAKPDRWKQFFTDLGGNNEEGVSLDFSQKDGSWGDKLSQWMEFWSPGNHDDRTLIIVY